MSNKFLLIVIGITFLIGGVAGFTVKSSLRPALVILPGEVKTEIVVKKIPVRITETKYIDKIKFIKDSTAVLPIIALSDSVKGIKDSVEYQVFHSMESMNDSVRSRWNINLNSMVKTLIKEKLMVELREVEVAKPFYSDGWFWASFISIPLLVLAIIF
jgi:hypothetical protein